MSDTQDELPITINKISETNNNMIDTQDELPITINKISETNNNMIDTQEKLSLMKDTKLELLNTLKSKSVSKIELISLFLKHDSFGIHYAICERLKNNCLDNMIPQLVSIMLRSNLSYPIYGLFQYWAARSIQFRISLFYTVRAILARGDENTASHCYRLCCDLFDIDRAVARKNMEILRMNYILGKLYRNKAATKYKSRSSGFIANPCVNNTSVNCVNNPCVNCVNNPCVNNTSVNNTSVNNPCVNNTSVNNTSVNNSIVNNPCVNNTSVNNPCVNNTSVNNPTVNNPTVNNPTVNNTSVNNPTVNNSIVNNSIVNNSIVNNSIVNNSTVNNTRVNSVKNRCVRINRTRAMFCDKSRMPTFEGLILYFVTSVASIISPSLYDCLDKTAHVLVNRKNYRSLIIKKNSRFAFHRTINFYDSLVEISNLLRTIPLALRQRILEVELEIVNMNIKNVLDMFNIGRKVVAIVVKECVILDSAENVPFRVVVETVDKGVCVNQRINNDFQKIEMLRSHLHSVNELYCGNDVNNIRENILDAIEKILHKIKRKSDKIKVISKDVKIGVEGEEVEEEEAVEIKKEEIKIEEEAVEAVKIEAVVINKEEEAVEGEEVEEEAVEINKEGEALEINKEEEALEINKEEEGEAVEINKEEIKIEEEGEAVEINKEEEALEEAGVEAVEINKEEVKIEGEGEEVECKEDKEDKEILSKLLNQRQLTDDIREINKKYEFKLFIDNLKVKQWQRLVYNISCYSEFSSLRHWNLFSFIVKSGSALKHEYLAYQLLTRCKEIFEIEKTGIYLRNYRINLISDTAGLVETVVDAYSIHNIKSQHISIIRFFENSYINQRLAKRNFLYSLVGYSIVSYIFQIKDRHNGNILIDSCGNIVHVDFGFILGTYPGFYCMENAPFKFSHEYFDIIDINDFRILFLTGFKAIRKHYKSFNHIMETVEKTGYCPLGGTLGVISRLVLNLSDKELEIHCKGLIDRSINNIRTTVYDKFQYFSNGYL